MLGKPQKVVIIAGPTAVGKTALLTEIQKTLQREQTKIEIINCDSVQVFCELDIASAKPSQELRQELPHHLVDILKPNEKFTAGDFVRSCEHLIPEIIARKALPIIAGGSIFYIKSLLYGLAQMPQTLGKFRSSLEQLSLEELQNKLQELDPNAKIHPNDRQRQIRACEVCLETGKPFSQYKVPKQVREDYEFLTIILERPRAELYQRINQRVEEMFASGLIDERKKLKDAGYQDLQGIGYRESFEHHKQLLQKTQQNSRNYAKRQITFLKQLPAAHFYHASDSSAIACMILQFYRT